VPIINGEYQTVGKREGGIITAEEKRFVFRMDNGYVINTLKSLVRDFECLDDGVRMTDTYEFSVTPTSVKERFVSLLPITIRDGEVCCGDSVMKYDKDALDAVVSEERVPRKGGKTDTVYYVDLISKKLDKNMSFTFTIN
jgi:hypothetical protein